MALNRNITYGQRWAVPDADDEQGSYKNKSDPTDTQASYLEANVLNDSFSGLQGAFLANKHANNDGTGAPTGYVDPTTTTAFDRFDASGVQDTAQASQVYNEWYKKTQDIVDAKNAEIQAIVDGCWFNYYNNDSLSSAADDTDFIFGTPDSSGAEIFGAGSNISITGTLKDKLTFAVAGVYKIFCSIQMLHTAAGNISFLTADSSSQNLTLNAKYFTIETAGAIGRTGGGPSSSFYGAEINPFIFLKIANPTTLSVQFDSVATTAPTQIGFDFVRVGAPVDVSNLIPTDMGGV